MKIGIYMDLRNPRPWRREPKGFYPAAFERVRLAENVGLDSVWFTEHHFWDDGYLPQPLTMAAAATAVTQRLTVGTAVVLAALRPAVDIAEQAAVIDNLGGGGRFELGLGAGYCVPQFVAFGSDITQRFIELEERVTSIRRLWAEGRVTPAPLTERIPIWIGGLGPRGARIAARTGEGLLNNDPALVAVFCDALARYGKDASTARVGGAINIVIADDPERAWPRVAPHLAYQWESYGYYGSLDGDARPGPASAGALEA